MGSITMILGGARSGKSAYAETILAKHPAVSKGYIATARVWDEEMALRVRWHRERRPDTWQTFMYDSPKSKSLAEILQVCEVYLFDCVTMYVNNLLMDRLTEEELTPGNNISKERLQIVTEAVEMEIQKLIDTIVSSDKDFIFVSDELGLGIVPDNPLSRVYRDLVGLANQRLTAQAQRVEFVLCGIPKRIK